MRRRLPLLLLAISGVALAVYARTGPSTIVPPAGPAGAAGSTGPTAAAGAIGPAGVTPGPASDPAAAPDPAAPPDPGHWTPLAPGLELGRFALRPSHAGDSVLHVARIHPRTLPLKLHLASQEGGRALSIDQWMGRTGALAAINPGMFASDWSSGVGYTATRAGVNNPTWASQQNSVLALDPVSAEDPPFRLLNLPCLTGPAPPSDAAPGEVTPATLTAGYRTRMQSIRGIGCGRENVWAEQAKEWSAAWTGQDSSGNALFLFVRSPYTMHALIDQLLALPLDLVALHYGEGGPEAFLAVRTPDLSETWTGSWETGFNENDDAQDAGDLPNVLVAGP